MRSTCSDASGWKLTIAAPASREIGDDAVDRLHHEVDVDRHRGVRLDRRADERSDGEVRNVMVVHHVEVQEVGARGDHLAHFLAQAREIGGQERRRNQVSRAWVYNRSGKYRSPPWRKREIRDRGRREDGVSRRPIGSFAATSTCSPTRSRSPTPATSPRSSSAGTGSSPTPSTRCRKSRALGVVGQQPLLKPGESFEYTSGTSLQTAVGTMRGTYQMVAEDGHAVRRDIPPFTLSVPRTLALGACRDPRRGRCRAAACGAWGPWSRHTIATAIRSATNASRRNHTILSAPFVRPRRAPSAPRHC